jgi:hypothetical protein
MGENCTTRIARRIRFSLSDEDEIHESEDHRVRSVAYSTLNMSKSSSNLSSDQLNSFRVRSRRLFDSPETPKMSVDGHHSNQTSVTPMAIRTRARALFTAGSAVKSSVYVNFCAISLVMSRKISYKSHVQISGQHSFIEYAR